MVRIQKWLFILHFDPFKFILEFRDYCSNLLNVHIPLETNVRSMSLRESPAAKRNRVPIGEALSKFLTTANARLLEIASGCGTHTMYLSEKFPQIEFQPSDFQDDAIESIQAHLKATPRSNVQSPLKIDVCDPYDRWRLPHENYDFLFNANMVHISPWKCTESLFANAGVVLKKGGILFMYGPFAINGVLEPRSNQEFDKTLKMNNPQWGIRD
eukprot:02441.XXX_58776_59480_1 [CDS] Oithona nana genome sequencing.